MKCDTCQYVKSYILAQDECGAGAYIEYCSKGHWENTPHEDLEEENTVQEIIDFWNNCKDYKERIKNYEK